MAERVGFEPTVALRRHAISSRAQSASLASLRLGPGRRRRYNDLSGAPRSGEGGIRTHDEVAPILVFETSALSRSATSPARNYIIGRCWPSLPFVVGSDDAGVFDVTLADEIQWVVEAANLGSGAFEEIAARSWRYRSEIITGREKE